MMVLQSPPNFLEMMDRSSYAKTVGAVRWEYSTQPVYGWGDIGFEQKATAGWLAAFPFFEPHWQVCMAGGLSSGVSALLHMETTSFIVFFCLP